MPNSTVSPVIATFRRSWERSLGDDDRNRLLKPLVPTLIGTRTNAADENIRAWMCLDWLVRIYAPTWLRLAGFNAQADLLVGLGEFKAGMDVRAVRGAARADGWSADWVKAWVAVWGSGWAAPRHAAWAAVQDTAAVAAWDAARDAAGDATRAAAWVIVKAAAQAASWAVSWAAVRAAAGDTAGYTPEACLRPVVDELQTSAVDLIVRLCEVGKVAS
jgi:hypothetical protein